MSYNYRTKRKQTAINIKISLKQAANTMKEQLYHFGLLQAPEVRIKRQTLPQLPATISR